MSQIICRNVSLAYDGITVSENVNFSVDKGDYLCIVGENGSGKSTLMKALLRLRPHQGGDIVLGDGIRQSDIGYLPQRSEAQRDFPASVGEVVLSGCVGRSDFGLFAGKQSRMAAHDSMKLLGICDIAGKHYSALSGGQMQRVLLARALCAAQKILLLDEPVAGLDPSATKELYETIRKLNRELGVTIIMITHDIAAVMRYATKVLHMSEKPSFYTSVSEYRESGDFLDESEVKHD